MIMINMAPPCSARACRIVRCPVARAACRRREGAGLGRGEHEFAPPSEQHGEAAEPMPEVVDEERLGRQRA